MGNPDEWRIVVRLTDSPNRADVSFLTKLSEALACPKKPSIDKAMNVSGTNESSA